MGRGRGRGGARSRQHDEAAAREALERGWAERLEATPDLSALVVAKNAQREPYHRWLSYRQGFSPELVRRFLQAADLVDGPVLDPFSGSGTVATECARRGVNGIGVDVVGSLAFMAAARGNVSDTHRRDAAQLLAAAATVDGEGHARRGGDAPDADAILKMMQEDLAMEPPSGLARLVCGDARRLPIADASVGGALTSPPYLSRYDYARVNDPAEKLWSGRGRRKGRARQLSASAATASGNAPSVHPAMEEAARRLDDAGRPRESAAVRGYGNDMQDVMAELARVMRPGAPLWFVVAGAELKRVYVPADLVCAELAAAAGFDIEAIRVARRLKEPGRRLGDLHHVAAREVVIVARLG